MNVVFLAQRVPYPPDRGDRITTYHFLQHFLQRGDRVRVGCLSDEPADAASIRELEKTVDAVCAPTIDRRWRRAMSLRGLATGQALTLPFFAVRPLFGAVRKWFQRDPPDLVYVYSSSMAQYALPFSGPARVMQFAELDSDKWHQYAAARRGLARWVYRREAQRLLEFERKVARAFDLSLVVSEVEKELFMERIPEVEPLVMPNGVDVDHFRSSGDAQRDPHAVLFTGVMDYEPNVDGVLWFARECWPAIRSRCGDARFTVVGARPTRAVMALAETPGIEVTGRVPQTPPYFDRAAVAVAPLRLARGVQNKVLEAMSMGLAVVASPQAAQGLGEVPAQALAVADGRDATVAAVNALLAEPPRARAMGWRAAAWVRAEFGWDRVFARFDAALERLLAARRG